MKKLALLFAFAILSVSLVVTPKTASATNFNFNPKVTICHKTESEQNPWETIEVSLNALGAHFAHGDHLGACATPSPTPTATPVPEKTDCPEETVQPSATPEVTSSPEPSETPAPTQQPTVPFSEPGPAYAPTQGACPALEDWIPQVQYVGFTHNTDGSYTFTYILKSVETENPTFLIWYGPTPEKFHSYPLIVQGKNKTAEVLITQEQSTNWIKAWHYAEPGCFGKNPSDIVN